MTRFSGDNLSADADTVRIASASGQPVLVTAQEAGKVLITLPTIGVSFYGDSTDGAVTFDGSTTILGMVPSGNVYTAVRDLRLTDTTINSGVTLYMASYRLFVQGTLTNNGTIKDVGSDGKVGSTTTRTGGNSAPAGTVGAGGNGASATVTTGTASGAGGGYGGRGGAGGAGVNAAGAAGTWGATAATVSGPYASILGTPTSSTQYTGGGGGAGGGGDGTNTGGSGGGGGGGLYVAARTIAGTGVIYSRGGDGGAGSPDSADGAGGGGGGGGGFVILISGSVVSGAVAGQTIDVNGGAGGAGVGTAGVAGAAGAVGLIFPVPN